MTADYAYGDNNTCTWYDYDVGCVSISFAVQNSYEIDPLIVEMVRRNRDLCQEVLLYWVNEIRQKIESLIDGKTMLFRRILRCNRKGIGLRIKDSR